MKPVMMFLCFLVCNTRPIPLLLFSLSCNTKPMLLLLCFLLCQAARGWVELIVERHLDVSIKQKKHNVPALDLSPLELPVAQTSAAVAEDAILDGLSISCISGISQPQFVSRFSMSGISQLQQKGPAGPGNP